MRLPIACLCGKGCQACHQDRPAYLFKKYLKRREEKTLASKGKELRVFHVHFVYEGFTTTLVSDFLFNLKTVPFYLFSRLSPTTIRRCRSGVEVQLLLEPQIAFRFGGVFVV